MALSWLSCGSLVVLSWLSCSSLLALSWLSPGCLVALSWLSPGSPALHYRGCISTIGLVSVHCDLVRGQAWSAVCLSVWQHSKLSTSVHKMHCAYCWNVKPPSNQATSQPTDVPGPRQIVVCIPCSMLTSLGHCGVIPRETFCCIIVTSQLQKLLPCLQGRFLWGADS